MASEKRQRQRANRPKRPAKARPIAPRYWLLHALGGAGNASAEAGFARADEVLELAGVDLGATEDEQLRLRLRESALFALGLVRYTAAVVARNVEDPDVELKPDLDLPPAVSRPMLEAALALKLASDLVEMHKEITAGKADS